MSDQPLTLKSHRETFLPAVRKIVSEEVSASERRMQEHLDAILHKVDKLETEYDRP